MENFTNKEDIERYLEAQKKVKNIKSFYIHLFFYIAVNIWFVYLNLKYSPEHLWFFYPTLGWGIGVFFHAAEAFDVFPFFNKKWEEKKIQELIEKEKNEQHQNWE